MLTKEIGDTAHGVDRARRQVAFAISIEVHGIAPKRGVASGATLLVPSGGSATPYLPDLPAPKVTVAKAPKKSAKHASRKGGKTANKVARKPGSAKKAVAGNGSKKIVLAQKPR